MERDASESAYQQLKAWDHRHLWHPFTQMRQWLADDPLIISRGEGNYLIDFQGNRYLDGVSSLWCNVHGHNRPEINAAIVSQLADIAHTTFLGLSNVPAIVLAEKLVASAPPGLTRVFYSDDGATAVEAALKMAVQYWQLKGRTRKIRFASLIEAYHGDTLGAVSVGYSDLFHHAYRPLLPACVRLPPPHLLRWREGLSETEALTRAVHEARRALREHGDELAALILEPLMQGAAGMWPQPAGYVRALREMTREHEVLLICDEVATGFGRTGKMFACEHDAVSPDLLCVAKGLTGGYLPLAATLTTEEIFSAFLGEPHEAKTFFHGHTYTGNPLCCAAAIASLELFAQDRVLEELGSKIAYLSERLEDRIAPLSHVADVRQRGVMVGIELMRDAASRIPYDAAECLGMRVVREARTRYVIVRPLGDVIILMPPLSITREEIDRLVETVRESIMTVTRAS